MATKKTFDFSLGADVRMALGNERGVVIGRAHYVDANPSYLVRYLAGDGRQTEGWLSESALAAVEPAAVPGDGEPLR